jgi:hypothetical protein
MKDFEKGAGNNDKTVEISSLSVVRESASAPSGKLHEHNFFRPHRGMKDKLTIRPGVNAFIIATAVALVTLILLGCSLPSFSFEQLGVLGLAIEFGRNLEEAKNDCSVFSITKTFLIDQGRFVGTKGRHRNNSDCHTGHFDSLDCTTHPDWYARLSVVRSHQ